MKYYSEKLNKFFDVEKDLVAEEKKYDAELLEKKKAAEAAEAERKKKAAERKADADAVKAAFDNAYKLREDFIKKYGSWHETYSEENLPEHTFRDFILSFFG